MTMSNYDTWKTTTPEGEDTCPTTDPVVELEVVRDKLGTAAKMLDKAIRGAVMSRQRHNRLAIIERWLHEEMTEIDEELSCL